jgi:DNA polymerase III sliding clamp (beta) subunit (PCNA family)
MAPIKSCLWAKANDGVRLVMDSICLNWLGPELETVVTDGVSLLITEHESQEDAATLVIPSGVADIIPSVFNTEDPLIVTFTDHHASINQNYTVYLKFRCLENKYPNTAAVIPAAFGDSVTILRENLVRALKLACPFSDDKSYRAVLQFGVCTLSVTAQNEVEETGMSRILKPEASTIKEDSDGTSICVNASKLLNILTKTVVTQKVYLSFSNHDGICVSPIRICGDDSEATAYLMPMHIPT